MRKIISNAQVTLDGVTQSPGGPEEDPRHGFSYGGWVRPFWDDALGQAMDEMEEAIVIVARLIGINHPDRPLRPAGPHRSGRLSNHVD